MSVDNDVLLVKHRSALRRYTQPAVIKSGAIPGIRAYSRKPLLQRSPRYTNHYNPSVSPVRRWEREDGEKWRKMVGEFYDRGRKIEKEKVFQPRVLP